MDTVIETHGLTKRFGSFQAVDAVSLTVKKGEIYGFLGLNGAGKTTTIRMLLGMIRPTSGHALIGGTRVSPSDRTLWSKVGYLVEIPYSYPELTVWENLEMVRRMRFVRDARAVDLIIERLGLGSYRDRKAKNLSLGNAQRLGLAKALIHDPEVLILDEPANGLDPAGIVEIRELLQSLARERGVTIFVSSHLLGEIARLATRIGIIHQGRMIQESDIEDLERQRHRRLLIDFRDRRAGLAALGHLGYSPGQGASGVVEIDTAEAVQHPDEVNAALVAMGCAPIMVRVEEEDLESYFLRVTGGDGGVS